MADFSNVIDQLQTNKEQNKTSLSGVNKNLAFRLGKINDNLDRGLKTLVDAGSAQASTDSNSVPTVPPKPPATPPTGFGTTEIGKILKNDIGGGLKSLGSKITDPLSSLAKSIPGLGTLGKLSKSLGKSAVKAISPTKKAEKDTEALAIPKKQTTFLEKIFNGIMALKLLTGEMLAKTGKFLGMGIGAFVGLLIAPIFVLVGFFASLGKELAFLKVIGKKIAGGKFFKVIGTFFSKFSKFVGKFTGLTKLKELGGGGIDKIIGSVKGFFGNIKNSLGIFTKAKAFVLGVDGKAVVQTKKFAKNAVNGLTTVKNFFSGIGKTVGGFVGKAKTSITPIVKLFKSIITTVGKVLAPITSGFKTGFGFVTKFAAGFGSVLGKIFLPITILMSAFDFITGFIDGFKIGGIMGGLEVGLAKLFGNLLGVPLDLLKQGIAWILEKFGFEDTAAALKTFSFKDLIMKGIGGLFDMVKFLINKMIEGVAVIASKLPIIGGSAAAKIRSAKFDLSKGNIQDQIKSNKAQELKLEKPTDGRAQEMTESKLAKESKGASQPVIVNNSNVIDNSSKSSDATYTNTSLTNNNPVVNAVNYSF